MRLPCSLRQRDGESTCEKSESLSAIGDHLGECAFGASDCSCRLPVFLVLIVLILAIEASCVNMQLVKRSVLFRDDDAADGAVLFELHGVAGTRRQIKRGEQGSVPEAVASETVQLGCLSHLLPPACLA